MSTIKLPRLLAPVEADTSNFTAGLGDTVKVAQSWGSAIKSAIVDKGLTFIIEGAKMAAQALLDVGKAVAQMVLDAAPLEGIGMAFDAMAGKVGLSLDALKQAAAGTISDFELMRMSNVALTGAGERLGVEFGQSLPKLLEIARAAARATGQDVGFLYNSLVSGVKRCSPMLIDNTGLVLKLGEANKQLAKELGKSVDQLTAEDKQIALLRATAYAGERMIADFGGGALTAAERLAQFKANTQNLKDQIGLAFIPVLEALLVPINNLLTTIGPLLIPMLQALGSTLGDLVDQGGDFVANFVQGLSGLVENLPNVAWIFEQMGAEAGFRTLIGLLIPQNAGEQLRAALSNVFSAIGLDKLLADIGIDSEALINALIPADLREWAKAKFSEIFSGLGLDKLDLGAGLDLSKLVPPQAKELLEAFIGLLGVLGTWWTNNGPRIQAHVEKVFTPIIEKGQRVVNQIMPLINDLLEGFGIWWTNNSPMILSLIELMIDDAGLIADAFLDLWIIAEPALRGLFNVVLDLATAFLEFMTTGEITSETFNKLAQDLLNFATDTLDAIVEWIGQVVFQCENFGQVINDVINVLIERGLGAIQQFVTDLGASVQGFFVNLYETWSTNFELIGLILSTAWQNFITTIRVAIANIVLGIAAFFTDLVVTFTERWAAIKQGVADIWVAITTAIAQKLAEIVLSVTAKITEIKTWIGEQVSRFKKIGEDLIGGLKNGIVAKAGEIVAAAIKVVTDAIEAAKSALGEHSASTVFSEIGGYAMEGMAQGIAKAGRMPVIEAITATRNVISEVSNVYHVNVATRAETGTYAQDIQTAQHMAGVS